MTQEMTRPDVSCHCKQEPWNVQLLSTAGKQQTSILLILGMRPPQPEDVFTLGVLEDSQEPTAGQRKAMRPGTIKAATPSNSIHQEIT